MNLTPLHLSILLHYNAGRGEFHPKSHTSDEYSQQMIDAGLLFSTTMNPGSPLALTAITPLGLTAKGRAFLRMISTTPLPEEAWVDPRTGEQIK